jgi:hypothetical protein
MNDETVPDFIYNPERYAILGSEIETGKTGFRIGLTSKHGTIRPISNSGYD